MTEQSLGRHRSSGGSSGGKRTEKGDRASGTTTMGIRIVCPNGHRLNLKAFLAGRRGLCPRCNARFRIPLESSDTPQPFAEPPRKKKRRKLNQPVGVVAGCLPADASGLCGSYVPVASPAAARPNSGQAAAEVWYVQPPSGGQYGPATSSLFRDWIKEGRVTEECLVWRDGWSEWQPASRLLKTDSIRQTGATQPEAATIGQAPTSSESVAISLGIPVTDSATIPLSVAALPRHLVQKKRKTSGFPWALVSILVVTTVILLVGLFVLLQNGQLSVGPSGG